MNRLIQETSPYLLQHARNPVDWWPWGDAAFEEARRTGKPVFLSVGYATCHWCHVMERESFEDETIARLLNDHFVPIKVDREERPDVDTIYMTAVQAVAGQGGWPMSVWLNHDREPFYAGTYFPPEDRWGRPGFATVLERLHALWESQREALTTQARELAGEVRSALSSSVLGPPGRPGAQALRAAVRQLEATFDSEWGGFGGAPKFPRSEVLRLLLRVHRRSGEAKTLEMVTRTLEAMHRGGLYDHLGGGFARYSTDRQWLVPHFEKMLYDNALLASAYLEAHQVTKDPAFARVVDEVLAWIAREMTSPEGAFYSAVDADSEGEEGRFYVWRPEELDALLGEEKGAVVRAYFGVTEAGNFEGKSVLHVSQDAAQVAQRLGMTEEQVEELVRLSRPVLLAARAGRVPPLVDDKILVSWNALAISAFAQAGRVLGRPDAVERARRAADFLFGHLRPEGRLLRTWRAGRAQHPATLEDHAFLAAACLDLFEATAEGRWLSEALALMEEVEARFSDPRGGWFSVADDAEGLLTRPREVYDGALPAGASVAALSALRLSALTGERRWREAGEGAVEAAGAVLERQPTIAPTLLCALDWILDRPWEVLIVEPPGASPDGLAEALRTTYLPNAVQVRVPSGAPRAELERQLPFLAGRDLRGGRPTAWLCFEGTCLPPTNDPEEVRRLLSEAADLPG